MTITANGIVDSHNKTPPSGLSHPPLPSFLCENCQMFIRETGQRQFWKTRRKGIFHVFHLTQYFTGERQYILLTCFSNLTVHKNLLEGLLERRLLSPISTDSGSVDLGWALRIYISKRFSGSRCYSGWSRAHFE